ncbi:RluA family pseudouridine synthase [Thermotoga caldifontis]|uniref:RluA family pseudouridine synthase n=1 Tax=Thermotoga caldifontis TaxID=1508419 RepID=UPI000597B9A4|nr:RluA family pseudouridine synthase [Thermotoga caldifontis]
MQLFVDKESAYTRLDKFLRKQLKNVPLSEIYKLLRTGKVSVNERTVKDPAYELEPGDTVEVDEDLSKYSRQVTVVKPVPLKLDIIYEDEDVLALNKKAGIALHPGDRTVGTTLIHGLMFYGKQKGFTPHLVHRLDRDTSGVLVVAKNSRTARILSHMFRERLVDKEYLALVAGQLRGHGKIDLPIDGLEAVTEYIVLENFDRATLVRVILHTGRTHQIRKHFAALGNPVVGDTVYGDRTANRYFRDNFGLRRQFLHCLRISFMHPAKPERLNLKAPLPEELEEVLERLRA